MGGAALAQPVITSLDTPMATRSGRIVVRGSGFGDRSSGGVVTIGGVVAHTARWSDGAISVYVPEGAPLGAADLRIDFAGEAATRSITITERPPPQGKLLWKFRTDGSAIRHRGSVAPDGTVYFSDSAGFLYSVSRGGALNWIYCADCVLSTGAEGPVSRAPDGTIFVGGNPLGPISNIHAVNPDGTAKWVYSDLNTDCVAGPSVGPDGNVYFVMETGGRGLTSLDSDTGAIRWSFHPTDQRFVERGQTGADIAFGRSTPGGPIDRLYTAMDMRPQQVPIPTTFVSSIFSFDLEGNLKWNAGTGGQEVAGGQTQGEVATGPDGTAYECSLLPPNAWALYAHHPATGATRWGLYLPPGNVMTEPTVAPDGTVLIVRNTIHLHAVRSNGSVAWTYTEPSGSLMEAPVASPDGRVIVSSGSTDSPSGYAGHIRAVSGSGQSLWSIFLPREMAGSVPVVPRTRAFFTPDSRRAYVGTSGSEVSGAEYAYLIALDTSLCGSPDLTGDGSADQDDVTYLINVLAGGANPANVDPDVNRDGNADQSDVAALVDWIAGGDCP